MSARIGPRAFSGIQSDYQTCSIAVVLSALCVGVVAVLNAVVYRRLKALPAFTAGVTIGSATYHVDAEEASMAFKLSWIGGIGCAAALLLGWNSLTITRTGTRMADKAADFRPTRGYLRSQLWALTPATAVLVAAVLLEAFALFYLHRSAIFDDPNANIYHNLASTEINRLENGSLMLCVLGALLTFVFLGITFSYAASNTSEAIRLTRAGVALAGGCGGRSGLTGGLAGGCGGRSGLTGGLAGGCGERSLTGGSPFSRLDRRPVGVGVSGGYRRLFLA